MLDAEQTVIVTALLVMGQALWPIALALSLGLKDLSSTARIGLSAMFALGLLCDALGTLILIAYSVGPGAD